MNKTFVTKMPNHIGTFLKASKCFASLGGIAATAVGVTIGTIAVIRKVKANKAAVL